MLKPGLPNQLVRVKKHQKLLYLPSGQHLWLKNIFTQDLYNYNIKPVLKFKTNEFAKTLNLNQKTIYKRKPNKWEK